MPSRAASQGLEAWVRSLRKTASATFHEADFGPVASSVSSRPKITRAWRIDQQGLVAPLEQMSTFAPQLVEPVGEGRLEPLHAGHEVALRRLQREVVVVAHDDERMQDPAGLGAGLEQTGLKGHLGLVRLEEIRPVVPAVDHMVARSGKLQTEFAGHARRVAEWFQR